MLLENASPSYGKRITSSKEVPITDMWWRKKNFEISLDVNGAVGDTRVLYKILFAFRRSQNSQHRIHIINWKLFWRRD